MVQVRQGVVIAGTRTSLENLKNFRSGEMPALANALAATQESHFQVVVALPEILKKAHLEIMPKLPKELGGGATSVVTEGVVWAGLSIEIGDTLSAKVIVQSADAKTAKDLAKLIDHALASAAEQPAIKGIVPEIAKITTLFKPRVEGDRLTVTLRDQDLLPIARPVLAKIQAAATATASQNNLKQLALAMHSYHDVYKNFPARASFDKDGNPLLSWRVLVLPFVGEAQLFKRFHQDEPWDSAHNKKLIAEMPQLYCPPYLKREEGKTTYLVPVGPKTIFEGQKGMLIKNITDGTSNTIMIVEANESRAVFWTQPEDYQVNPKDPSAGLFRDGSNRTNAAFADGAVRSFDRKLPAKTWRALFTANGGELVELP
jgi:prepilin-type processing-associated H-X9-DG protein